MSKRILVIIIIAIIINVVWCVLTSNTLEYKVCWCRDAFCTNKELSEKDSCRKEFLSWCNECQLNNWKGYLEPGINMCLKDYFDVDLPKSVTCESAKESCCLIKVIKSENKESSYDYCLKSIDNIEFFDLFKRN